MSLVKKVKEGQVNSWNGNCNCDNRLVKKYSVMKRDKSMVISNRSIDLRAFKEFSEHVIQISNRPKAMASTSYDGVHKMECKRSDE